MLKVSLDSESERYFILHLREHSIFEHMVRAFSPTFMQLIEVDRETYHNYSTKIYDSFVKAADHLDQVSFGMTMILSIFFFSQSILSNIYPESLKELMTISGLIGFIGALVIRYDGSRISLLDAAEVFIYRPRFSGFRYLDGDLRTIGCLALRPSVLALIARNFGMLIVKPESELS